MATRDGDHSMDARDHLAEALALQMNGPASDGRGWYRTEVQREDCYARADAIMDAPGWVLLALTDDGRGSRSEIAEYVREVIEQRTVPDADTTAERIAQGITTSILSRLGAGISVAARHA